MDDYKFIRVTDGSMAILWYKGEKLSEFCFYGNEWVAFQGDENLELTVQHVEFILNKLRELNNERR